MIHFPADTVDDDAAHASVPIRMSLCCAETGFADHVAGAQFAVTGFDLLFAGFTNVSGGVGEEATGHVAAAGDGEHLEDGNIGTVRLDKIEVGAGGFRLDDDGLEFREIASVLQLVVQIVDGDAKSVRNGGEVLFDQLGIVAQEKHAEAGTIVNKDAAIAIEHAATRRDDGNGADAVCWPSGHTCRCR